MAERVVTREHAAKSLRCSMRTIERMLRDGRLRSVQRDDGRLSVDGEDLALVLANPELLEERRAAVSHEAAAPSSSNAERFALPGRPLETRLTALDRSHDAPRPPRSQPQPQTISHARLARVAGAIAVAAAIATVAFSQAGRHDAAPPAHTPTTHTPATHNRSHAAVTSLGGRASAAPARADVTVTIRGGRSETVETRARPQARRAPLSESQPPASGHARVGARRVVINCGFGSLAMAAC